MFCRPEKRLTADRIMSTTRRGVSFRKNRRQS